MEGNRSCVVSLALVLMMVMIVAAQTHESQALDMDVHPTAFTGQCLKKCGLKCRLFIIKPPAFALCFTPCMAACKFLPSHVLSSCTANCANSRPLAHNPESERAGDEEIGDYVGSCFHSCHGN